MINPIPFEIPAKFAAGIADGSILRFGTLLKEAGSGQILAHVQETGLAQQIVGKLGCSLLTPVSSLLNVASSAYANVQLHQLKKMVEGLQALQFATLGVGIAGIGVSVVGFALMNKKLNAIQKQIRQLSDRIDQHFVALEQRNLRSHFSLMNGLLEEAEQAYWLKDPSAEWKRVSGEMAREGAFFQGELAHLLENKIFHYELFIDLFQSYAMCTNGRTQCMILSNELEFAQRVTQDTAKNYNKLFDSLIPSELASKALYPHVSKSSSSIEQLRVERRKMEELVHNVRDAQDAAATKPHLLGTLIEREIDGRQCLDSLRNNDTHSLLLLPALLS